VGKVVMEYRKGKDVYRNLLLDFTPESPLQLDHVVENHIIRDNYDIVTKTKQGTNSDSNQKSLASDLKDIVNQEKNLNFTTKPINLTKFRATYNFQEDFRKVVSVSDTELGLVHYLKQQAKLSRQETARIQKEIVRSYEFIEDSLQSELPLHSDFADALRRNFTAMRLD